MLSVRINSISLVHLHSSKKELYPDLQPKLKSKALVRVNAGAFRPSKSGQKKTSHLAKKHLKPESKDFKIYKRQTRPRIKEQTLDEGTQSTRPILKVLKYSTGGVFQFFILL
jgi:hypothetical protein